MARAEALPARKGRCAREEYVADSRPEGIEKTDMVGEPGKVSPTDSSERGMGGTGGEGENLPRGLLRGRAVTVLSSSWSAKLRLSSSSDESQLRLGPFSGTQTCFHPVHHPNSLAQICLEVWAIYDGPRHACFGGVEGLSSAHAWSARWVFGCRDEEGRSWSDVSEGVRGGDFLGYSDLRKLGGSFAR
jgi:hypothetical protein